MKKVPVSERALVARINRKLEQKGQSLRRCREDSRSSHQLGRYFVIDLSLNALITADCDLETVGRELGVLKAFENAAG
jgi:hypothetical protein